MRQIPLSYGLLFFLDELEYTEAGLSADPQAEALAVPFREAMEEWDALFKSERIGRRNVIRAEALVAVGNARLDAMTVRLGNLAKAIAPDLLTRLFKTAPGKFVKTKLRKQCEDTTNIILPELAKLDDSSPMKSFDSILGTMASVAVKALDNRATAFGARTMSANDVLEWKEGVNSLRTTTYAELLKISVAHDLPKSWVDAFFRKDEADEKDEPAAPAPAPTEPKPG